MSLLTTPPIAEEGEGSGGGRDDEEVSRDKDDHESVSKSEIKVRNGRRTGHMYTLSLHCLCPSLYIHTLASNPGPLFSAIIYIHVRDWYYT